MRLATFDLAGTADDESAWNDWVDQLAAQGLRPADEPLRWTETTMTFRVFSIVHEQMRHTLDFDISRITVVGGSPA